MSVYPIIRVALHLDGDGHGYSDRRGGHVQRSGNDSVMGVLRRREKGRKKAAGEAAA